MVNEMIKKLWKCIIGIYLGFCTVLGVYLGALEVSVDAGIVNGIFLGTGFCFVVVAIASGVVYVKNRNAIL